jgi:SAM-dependent methyltransferase
MKIVDNYFEKQSCPLCETDSTNSRSRYFVIQYDSFRNEIRECLNCGLHFKKNFPTEDYLIALYGAGYSHYSMDNFADDVQSFYPRIDRIQTQTGRLLDYGCGNAASVKAALNRGFDAYGNDPFVLPSKNFLSGRLFSLDAAKHRLRELGEFDVISMWATVEHLVDSRNTFSNIISILKEDAILVFNSPYGSSLAARLKGGSWHMARISEHLQFHTRKSIKYICKMHGLELSSSRICGSPFPFGLNYTQEVMKNTKGDKISINEKKKITFKLSNFILAKVSKYLMFFRKFSWFISILRIGDHIEVQLTKIKDYEKA